MKANRWSLAVVATIVAFVGLTQTPFAYDGRCWLRAKKANTLDAYREYERRYPEGRHLVKARACIEEFLWQEALEEHTIRSIQAYVQAYPQGQFLDKASREIEVLRKDDAPFRAVLRERTQEALTRFRTDFPGHVRLAEAELAVLDLAEAGDFFELLAARQIEAQAVGDNIRAVSLSVRRLVPRAMLIRVPAGSFFVPANESSQNMVTTADSRIELIDDGWKSVGVSVACANRSRHIPNSHDTFTIKRAPEQVELARLASLLNESNVEYATKQAAVWIVTDDATYGDLGTLVLQFGGRVIGASQTAEAMQLCDKVGIDITRKAIWKDRDQILAGLEASTVKDWLTHK
jgi:hypothetical protein